MKYLCLCYYDPRKFAALSKTELEAIVKECAPRDEALRKSGKVIALGSLSLPETWKAVRPGNDGPVATDGPYADTRDQVGAFFVVEASDMDEAVQVASMHPAAHAGKHLGWGVEVRACEMFEQL